MNTGKPYKHEDRSRAAAIRKRQREQRRMWCILITAILIIFSLGTIFGCFLASAFVPDTVNAAEETVSEPTAVQATAPEKQIVLLSIESGGRKLPDELQETMIQMCEKYELPFALAVAVAEQESHFDPDAVSHTNDYGIMQINKINFSWLQKKGINPLDHKGNIEAGVLMLSEAVKKYDDFNLALMAYNCGDAGAKRLWNKGIYSTEYSNSVMERYNKWDSYIRGV